MMFTWIRLKEGSDEIDVISRAKPHPNKLADYTKIPVEAFAGQRWDGKDLIAPDVVVVKEQVNDEAKRLIYNLLGVKDEQASNIKQNNLRSEYSELQDVLIDGGQMTTEQAARRAQIQGGNAMLKAIVVASNVLTDMSPIPPDFANPENWPVGS